MQWCSAHQASLRRFRVQHASLADVFHSMVDRNRIRNTTADVAGETR